MNAAGLHRPRGARSDLDGALMSIVVLPCSSEGKPQNALRAETFASARVSFVVRRHHSSAMKGIIARSRHRPPDGCARPGAEDCSSAARPFLQNPPRERTVLTSSSILTICARLVGDYLLAWVRSP